jgi:hypothetical protein
VNSALFGLRVDNASALRVKSSFFVDNGLDGINANAPGTVLTNVVTADSGEAGVRLLGDGNGKLERSIIAANLADGVRIEDVFGASVPSQLKSNLIVGNAADGVVVTTSPVGMVLDGNLSGGNGGHGIALQNHPDLTTVTKNVLIGNVRDGIFVDTPVQQTAIVQNRAFGNGVSGLNVDNTASTLVKNLAIGNLVSGIRTPSGAIDGGGNQAHDNVGSPQCTAPLVCP